LKPSYGAPTADRSGESLSFHGITQQVNSWCLPLKALGSVVWMTNHKPWHTLLNELKALGSVVWMTRLGSFLFTRISRDGKDGRFDALKTVWLSFMGAWGLQAAWVLLIQLPVVLVNSQLDHVPLNPVDVVAMLVWVSGFLIEGIADAQKFKFRVRCARF